MVQFLLGKKVWKWSQAPQACLRNHQGWIEEPNWCSTKRSNFLWLWSEIRLFEAKRSKNGLIFHSKVWIWAKWNEITFKIDCLRGWQWFYIGFCLENSTCSWGTCNRSKLCLRNPKEQFSCLIITRCHSRKWWRLCNSCFVFNQRLFQRNYDWKWGDLEMVVEARGLNLLQKMVKSFSGKHFLFDSRWINLCICFSRAISMCELSQNWKY